MTTATGHTKHTYALQTQKSQATLARLEALLDDSSVPFLNGSNEQFVDAETPEPESR